VQTYLTQFIQEGCVGAGIHVTLFHLLITVLQFRDESVTRALWDNGIAQWVEHYGIVG